MTNTATKAVSKSDAVRSINAFRELLRKEFPTLTTRQREKALADLDHASIEVFRGEFLAAIDRLEHRTFNIR